MSEALPYHFEISSELDAQTMDVWRFITDMDCVNQELRPWLRMTTPERGLSLTDERFVLGERLFRSGLLVLGVLPVDYDDVVIESIDPGREFNERSSMLTQRAWHHDRLLEPTSSGTRITDRLAWSPRLPGAGALYALIVPWLFRWRHRRLRRQFGGRALVGWVERAREA